MHILITGGSGFIGTRLCQACLALGYQVTILTRNKIKTREKFKSNVIVIDNLNHPDPANFFDVIINLAGERISDGRWSMQKKRLLLASRLNTTQMVIDYIAHSPQKPKLLINGSAIGYYGCSEDKTFTEQDLAIGHDFAHELCAKWESKAYEAQKFGVRVCCLRTGIVLAKNDGALAKMLLPFQLGLGGPIGSGKQWLSWVHLDDLVGIILQIINHEKIDGPVNGTAPSPVTNYEFAKTLGKVLHRPTFFTMPAFVLKGIFGEMADNLLLKGQKVLPNKIIENGYIFKYETLEKALTQILNHAQK